MRTLSARIEEAGQALQFGRDTEFERMSVHYDRWEYFAEQDPETGWPAEGSDVSAEAFVTRAKNWTSFGWWLYGWWIGVRVLATHLRCEILDHEYVEEGWAGPDSGGMAVSCSRCGWSCSVTMY